MKTTLASFSALAALGLFACSSTNTTTDASRTDPGGGPPIAADQVGSACSGVGTSPGDTALFAQSECPAGYCVADARTDFDTYCTADCSGKTCPDGFTCAEVTFGDVTHACLKDGSSAPDAGKDSGSGTTKPQSGTIGQKIDKGVKSVDVDISSHGSYRCDDACTKAGGTCTVTGNGAGWIDRKYNDGSGTTGNQIDSCSEPQDYVSFNTTLTDMSCFCDGMTVPTTVKVTKSDGLFACDAVCASWKLGCSATRKSYAFDATETTETTLTCAATPASATDHYVCACDP